VGSRAAKARAESERLREVIMAGCAFCDARSPRWGPWRVVVLGEHSCRSPRRALQPPQRFLARVRPPLDRAQIREEVLLREACADDARERAAPRMGTRIPPGHGRAAARRVRGGRPCCAWRRSRRSVRSAVRPQIIALEGART
jgi:hypothetical protein